MVAWHWRQNGGITKGHKETFGGDMFIILIVATVPMVYTYGKTHRMCKLYAQFTVCQSDLHKSVNKCFGYKTNPIFPLEQIPESCDFETSVCLPGAALLLLQHFPTCLRAFAHTVSATCSIHSQAPLCLKPTYASRATSNATFSTICPGSPSLIHHCITSESSPW